jgi:hypothetical protein
MAIKIAIRTSNNIDFDNPSVVRIKNTSEMDYIWVSEKYWSKIKDNKEIELMSSFEKMNFDNKGFLI